MISAMMEAVNTSETSVNFNVTTRHYIPEDSKLCNKYVFNLSNKNTLQYKNEEISCRSNNQSYVAVCIFFFLEHGLRIFTRILCHYKRLSSLITASIPQKLCHATDKVTHSLRQSFSTNVPAGKLDKFLKLIREWQLSGLIR
jgi:hypothetical protein